MNPATPEKKPTKPGPPPLSALKQKLAISTAMTPPIRGGELKTHGIYIVGGTIIDDWKLPGKYCYTSQLFAIEKTSGKVHDLLKDYHMFTVAEAIDSYDKRAHPTIKGGYSYEEIERDDFELSRLVVEFLLSEEIRDKMRV
jgi:hypothetical protein